MRVPTAAALAILLLASAPALAQSKGRKSDTTLSKPLGSRLPAPRLPTVRDIEDMSPASLLVDRRKKLGLADSTVSQLKALEKAIKVRNAPTLALYDSVRRRMNNSLAQDGATATPALQEEDRQNRTGIHNLFVELSDRRAKDAQEALALLPEEKRKLAGDFLTEQADDFVRLMPGARQGQGLPPDGP